MIKLTDINGRAHYVAPNNIVRITEAGTSSQWHGIRSFVKTSDGVALEASETVDKIAAQISEVGALQAEIAGHEAANLHLSRMVDDLRELVQDAHTAMTELHQAAVPDESQEGVPAIMPPDAFRRFVDAHAMLSFCLHQLGHGLMLEKPERYEITSIKYLAGEMTLRTADGAEVPQSLESGQVVTLK